MCCAICWKKKYTRRCPEEGRERGEEIWCFLRIRRESSERASLRVFRVARRAHDLYFLYDHTGNVSVGATREAVEKGGCNRTGEEEMRPEVAVNLSRRFNENLYNTLGILEDIARHFWFTNTIDQLAGCTFDWLYNI